MFCFPDGQHENLSPFEEHLRLQWPLSSVAQYINQASERDLESISSSYRNYLQECLRVATSYDACIKRASYGLVSLVYSGAVVYNFITCTSPEKSCNESLLGLQCLCAGGATMGMALWQLFYRDEKKAYDRLKIQN